MKKHRDQPDTAAPKREPYRVHLPGMLIEGEIGLGDLIKKTTYKIGIQRCGGRAAGRGAQPLGHVIPVIETT
jgi:hypothetical protein